MNMNLMTTSFIEMIQMSPVFPEKLQIRIDWNQGNNQVLEKSEG